MSGLEAGTMRPASEGRAQGGAFSYGRLPDLPRMAPGRKKGAFAAKGETGPWRTDAAAAPRGRMGRDR